MNEKWRAVVEDPNYEVSDLGNFRSKTRRVACKNGSRTVRGRSIKPFLVKSTGYLQVSLSGGKRYSAHRLVAMAWRQNFFEGAWVDHLNGDRQDNRASNLEWVTPGENTKRSYNNGRVGPWAGKRSRDHNAAKSVISKCLTTGEETYWPAAMDAVRAGFDSSAISRCANGEYKSHRGFEWRFAAQHGISLGEPA